MSSNSPSRCTLNTNECIYLPKDMDENVHGIVFVITLRLEATQMSINSRMDCGGMVTKWNSRQQ